MNITVNIGDRSYCIEIGDGNLLHTDFTRFGTGRYVIITDSNVKALYGEDLQRSLRMQGLNAELLEFPAGERSKTWEQAGNLGRELARREYDRGTIILALGGGVVGDLAGFVASFYERGLEYLQLPTTLLAQVDSSIGGKTGIDIPEGKNMFGHFHQPKAVIIDTETLQTLPECEVVSGLAEVIKYGMIQDRELFEYVEQNFSSRTPEFYSRIVEKSCQIKAGVVEQDEKEAGLRRVLNYGHTVGHAIECAESYKIPHGEAVCLGMVYEGEISSRLGLLAAEDLERQNRLIQNVGFPMKYGGGPASLVEIMKRDKKNTGGKIHFVLTTSIGSVREEDGRFIFPVDESLVREVLRN